MIYVHMGMPKTGTTSLQHAMSKNSALLASAGVNYVCADGVSANRWFEHLRPIYLQGLSRQEIAQRVQQTRSAILPSIAMGGATILSAETLSNIDPELLVEIFEDHECRFIAYIRDELSFLASSYAQAVHANPAPPKLAEYMEVRSEHHLGKFLNKFNDTLGGSFVPRIFNRKLLKGGDVVADFFHHFFPELGVDLDLGDNTDKNPSLTDEVIAFKLEMAATHPHLFSPTLCQYEALVSLASYFGQRFRLPRDPYEELAMFYSESQAQWAKDFFGRASVFNYHEYPFTKRTLENILPERLREEMLQVYQRLITQDLKPPR